MNPNAFVYDVAFSFLGRDEGLAADLNDRLRTRVRTFIYSDTERQTKLAGRDGADAFARVFGVEAMTVVVLYREGWGDVGFTAPEATAIRNRAHEQGFDFTTFVPLDVPPTVPLWLPKTRLWVSRDRWGLDAAAAVIESRVQEAGGSPAEESAATVLRRLTLQREAANRRAVLTQGPNAIENARREFASLVSTLTDIAKSIDDIQAHSDRDALTLRAGHHLTTASFHQVYANTLAGSYLQIMRHTRDRQIQSTSRYEFDTNGDGTETGWRGPLDQPSGRGVVVVFRAAAPEFTPCRNLADAIVRRLLEDLMTDEAAGR